MTKVVGCLVVSALVVAGCDPNDPDGGGLTFDFNRLSERRFSSENAGANIAAGVKPHPSYGIIYLPNWKGAPLPEPADVKTHISWTEENGEYVLTSKPSLLGLCGGNAEIAQAAMSGWMYDIPHDGSGGEYVVSVSYKMGHTVGNWGGLHVNYLVVCDGFTRRPFENCDSEWKGFTATIKVPKGVKKIPLGFTLDGIGELRIRDVRLSRVQPDPTEVTITQAAHGHVDKSFAVGAGQLGAIAFFWRSRADAKFDPNRLKPRLTLPRGYRFVAANWGRKDEPRVVAQADGSSEVFLPSKPGGVGKKWDNWQRFSVLVEADAKAQEGAGTFAAYYDDTLVSNVETTRWFTIPPVKVAAKPKRYRNGFIAGSNTGIFDDREAMFRYAKMTSDAGADWFMDENPTSNETSEIYRRAGVTIQTPHINGVRNGYHIDGDSFGSDEKHRPEEDCFVPRDPKAHHDFPGSVCPLAIVEKRPYFMTNTVPRLAKVLKGCDGLWTNWEPFGYVGQGCMCARCRKDFAKTLGLADLAQEAWEKETVAGGKYYDALRTYRGEMLGKMLKTLDRELTASLNGEDSSLQSPTFTYGLIPGVAWCEMGSYWRPSDYPSEAKEIHYAGDMRWMNPWGPYPCWHLDGVFSGAEGAVAVYWFAAKDVREQVNKDYPLPKRPKLVSFPHGSQADEWITEPEWIGLALDSFFFNKWEASVVYFFPKGYDARYWRAFAEATDRAAKYEDFVWDGRRCDDEVVLATPGFDRRHKGCFEKWLPNVRDISLVQYAAYEKDGKLIVSVLNFADAQPAKVVLSHPMYGRQTGVVPAARCRVFEFMVNKQS